MFLTPYSLMVPTECTIDYRLGGPKTLQSTDYGGKGYDPPLSAWKLHVFVIKPVSGVYISYVQCISLIIAKIRENH